MSLICASKEKGAFGSLADRTLDSFIFFFLGKKLI